ncbi:MAG: carbonic anhydrase [Nanobdellota archaeon]
MIAELLKNNAEYVESHGHLFEELVKGQNPQVTLITCADSRVPTRVLAEDNENKLFVIENIGNQLKTAQGSVDYGVLHLKTPYLIILGHSDCGAIKAATKDYSEETNAIKRELDHVKKGIGEGTTDEMAKQNVDHQVSLALERYGHLIDNEKLTIFGMMMDFSGMYGEEKGKVHLINVNGSADDEAIKRWTQ